MTFKKKIEGLLTPTVLYLILGAFIGTAGTIVEQFVPLPGLDMTTDYLKGKINFIQAMALLVLIPIAISRIRKPQQ